jgi:hypothetical protein
VEPDTDTYEVIYGAAGDNAVVMKIPTSNSNEYFLVENRQNSGYDRGLAHLIYTLNFGGLAVWHIDDSIGSRNGNNDNADAGHKRVDLVAAQGDGAIDNGTSYGRNTNLFYEGNVTAVNDGTDPDTRLYNGGTSGIALSEISPSGSSMTLYVSFTADVNRSTATSSDNAGSGSSSDDTSAAAPAGGGGGGGSMDVLMAVLFVMAASASLARRPLKVAVARISSRH